jgi:hypothetical protein
VKRLGEEEELNQWLAPSLVSLTGRISPQLEINTFVFGVPCIVPYCSISDS